MAFADLGVRVRTAVDAGIDTVRAARETAAGKVDDGIAAALAAKQTATDNALGVADRATAAGTVVVMHMEEAGALGDAARAGREARFAVRNALTGLGYAVTGDTARGGELLARSGRQALRAGDAVADAAKGTTQATRDAKVTLQNLPHL